MDPETVQQDGKPEIVDKAVANMNCRWREMAEWVPTWLSLEDATRMSAYLTTVEGRQKWADYIDFRMNMDEHDPTRRLMFIGSLMVQAILHRATGTLETTKAAAVTINGRVQICLVTSFENEVPE